MARALLLVPLALPAPFLTALAASSVYVPVVSSLGIGEDPAVSCLSEDCRTLRNRDQILNQDLDVEVAVNSRRTGLPPSFAVPVSDYTSEERPKLYDDIHDPPTVPVRFSAKESLAGEHFQALERRK